LERALGHVVTSAFSRYSTSVASSLLGVNAPDRPARRPARYRFPSTGKDGKNRPRMSRIVTRPPATTPTEVERE
jgi:hypothetical protein